MTGSASLETFKRGGDSLMGRYFPYRLHPLSVGECLGNMASGPLCTEPIQAAMDAEFVGRDCFGQRSPIIVPARTLLAQLA